MKNDKKAKRGKEGFKERVNSSEGQVENWHFSTSYLIQSDSFWPFSVRLGLGLVETPSLGVMPGLDRLHR